MQLTSRKWHAAALLTPFPAPTSSSQSATQNVRSYAGGLHALKMFPDSGKGQTSVAKREEAIPSAT